MIRLLILSMFLVLIVSCSRPTENIMKAKLSIELVGETKLIQSITLKKKNNGDIYYQGQEEDWHKVEIKPKSTTGKVLIIFPLGVYQNTLEFLLPHTDLWQYLSKQQMKGHWVRHDRNPMEKYSAYLKQQKRDGSETLQSTAHLIKPPMNGKYKLTIKKWPHPQGHPTTVALGNFSLTRDQLSQLVIVLTTGDLGVMEQRDPSRLIYQVFNGVFAYVVEVLKVSDKTIEGTFTTATEQYDFTGELDDQFDLGQWHAQAKITVTDKPVVISLPEVESGELIQTSTAPFFGKPMILQIYGSWCPNCLDETRYLTELLKDQKYTEKFEILALAFEKTADLVSARQQVSKTIRKVAPSYPFVIASHGQNTTEPQDLLPIENFSAYPTTLFLDKNHHPVAIHTGFASKSSEEEFEKMHEQFLKKLNLIIQDQ